MVISLHKNGWISPMDLLQRVGQIHLKITASSIEQMRPGQLPRHTLGEAPC